MALYSKFNKIQKSLNPRSSPQLMMKKQEENYSKACHNKININQGVRGDTLKVTRLKTAHYEQQQNIMKYTSQKKMQSRRQWNNIFKAEKEKNCQPRILYPAKMSF